MSPAAARGGQRVGKPVADSCPPGIQACAHAPHLQRRGKSPSWSCSWREFCASKALDGPPAVRRCGLGRMPFRKIRATPIGAPALPGWLRFSFEGLDVQLRCGLIQVAMNASVRQRLAPQRLASWR